MGRKKKDNQDETLNKCKYCGLEISHGEYCSSYCEISDLKDLLAEKEKRILTMRGKRGEKECLGRVEWGTCCQEVYTKRSYDARRRAGELRKMGFKCRVILGGDMPILVDGKIKYEKVSIVTCDFRLEPDGTYTPPPKPDKIIDGVLIL